MKFFTLKKVLLAAGILGLASLLLAFHYKRHKSPDVVWSEQPEQPEQQQPAVSVKPHLSLRERLEPKKGEEIPSIRVSWQDLSLLDYKNGIAPEKIKELEAAETIKIPGFIVPLTDDYVPFDEFLIVPDQMACIHAPPPPANQMLYVKTIKPLPIGVTMYPLWFYGKLSVTKTDSFYGAVGYVLKLQHLEIYKAKNESAQ